MMTHELMGQTTREWAFGNPRRASRELELHGELATADSAEEIADALIRIAGRKMLEETRAW